MLPTIDDDESRHLKRMGKMHVANGDYDEAMRCYKLALELDRQPGTPPLALPITLNNLGVVLKYAGEYEAALKFYSQALKIKRLAEPNNHASLATSFYNMGRVLQRMGGGHRNREALGYLRQSLDEENKVVPRNPARIAATLQALGQACDAEPGMHEQALRSYEQALDLYRQSLPPDHVNVATALEDLGNAWLKANDTRKAFECLHQAAEVFEKTFPSDHPNQVRVHDKIIEMLTR